jgi:putative aldouronate transport system permease protein
MNTLATRLKRYWFCYLLILPTIAYFLIYHYYPIFLQFVLAFKEYRLGSGIWGSKWATMEQLTFIFGRPEFTRILRNTIEISLLRLFFGFWPPIFLALLLFDLQSSVLRKTSQTILYIPHFFSWVIVYSMFFSLFNNDGLINSILNALGQERRQFLLLAQYFRPMIIGSGIWKSVGWGTIIYMAALTNINTELYDAVKIDGGGPIKRMRYVSIPGILPVIVFLLTLSIGGLLVENTEQILLFYSPANYEVSDIIGTWVYRQGLERVQYSLGARVNFFQSLIGLVLVVIANKLSIRFANVGVW